MIEVILTRGLPGSGKSTWAKALVAENPGSYKRVNRDDLRTMLGHTTHSKANEKFVLGLRDHIVLASIEAGKHVVVDDLNLSAKHEAHLKQLTKGKAVVRVEQFDTPVEVCIARDLARPNSVGEKVIRQLHQQFFAATAATKVDNVEGAPSAIIVDLDGTYALMGDRSPYDAAQAEIDSLNEVVHSVVTGYLAGGANRKVILCSGRQSEYREQTERWLARHQITYEALFMRATGDSRKDSIVKRELFDENIRGNYNIDFVLDDRNQVVDMWRNELGLTCLQVAEGNF